MAGAILKKVADRGGILRDIWEAIEKAKNEFSRQGLLLFNMIDILKRLSYPYHSCFMQGCFMRVPSEARQELLESLRGIVRVSPSTRAFLTRRPYIANKTARWFSEAVWIPVNPTLVDIESCLELSL